MLRSRKKKSKRLLGCDKSTTKFVRKLSKKGNASKRWSSRHQKTRELCKSYVPKRMPRS